MQAKPAAEHEWLKKFIGQWAYSGQCPAGPDSKEMLDFSGTERIRAVGDLWIQGEATGKMPGGGESTMLLTVGFDPAKGRYVGTWVGSMMTHLWVYEGWVEPDGRTLILEAEGPSFTEPGKTTLYRDINEFKSDDHRAFRAEVRGADGAWSRMMSMDYRRQR